MKPVNGIVTLQFITTYSLAKVPPLEKEKIGQCMEASELSWYSTCRVPTSAVDISSCTERKPVCVTETSWQEQFLSLMKHVCLLNVLNLLPHRGASRAREAEGDLARHRWPRRWVVRKDGRGLLVWNKACHAFNTSMKFYLISCWDLHNPNSIGLVSESFGDFA